MHDPIQQAIDYANRDRDGAPYHLHVRMVDGSTITGATYGNSAAGIGVEARDGCTFIHFINPAHVVHVRLEWL